MEQESPEHTKPDARQPLRLAILLSGSGRTLENLVRLIDAGELDAWIVAVISSRAAVRGVEVARAAGLPVTVLPRRRFGSVEEFSAAVYAVLDPLDVDLVVLAGFLSKLTVPPRYAGRIINIHPSLLPAFSGKGFYGERVHQAVLDAGLAETGCTVHVVNEEYDAGPVILQHTVPVEPGDTAETLGARVFAAECRLYPEVIRLFAEGRIRVEGDQVHVLPS